MPRIDPLQLLKCLSVLLSPDGGILSRDEVPRLVNLMTKFSKKLVSKCVYVLILTNTETSLVDMFMAEGGWTLIQTWLQDAAQSGNWDLVKEILGLLLITPVDVERLKMNCLPKLIKNLSRKEDLGDVAQLSNQIVQNWLIIVKGSAHHSITASSPARLESGEVESKSVGSDSKENGQSSALVLNSSTPSEEHNEVNHDDNIMEDDQAINPTTFYRVAVKDGKQVIRKLSLEEDKSSNTSYDESDQKESLKEINLDKVSKSNEKEKSSKSSSSSKSKSSSSSREKDRVKDKKKESSRRSDSKSKSSSSSSRDKDKDKKSKEKERDRKDRDKDKSKRSSSSKSSSKSGSSSKDRKDSKDKNKSGDAKESKEPKEKQAEKDKDTLEKVKPPTLDKLGRIPKKSSDEKQKENKNENKPKEITEKKKPSFSILNRKATGEERTKTVKVFNSKMRSTGLEEEVKPPPPRSAKKPTPSVQLPTIPSKRPSPPREPITIMPPEKKLKMDKIDIPERPGAIKLIPPKPKPAVLQESDMFMDALTAAAPKKETKKRKRRLSVTKDIPTSPSSSPVRADGQVSTSPTPSSPTTTALGLKNLAPINFYQDTLSEESGKTDDAKDETVTDEIKDIDEDNGKSAENVESPNSPSTPTDNEMAVDNEGMASPPKQIKLEGGLKGVLLYAKKKGPKKSITWKTEADLVEIRYFELDETERVNVTKTFMDMAKMEVTSEREALIMSRKLPNEDVMEPQTLWRMLYVCDQPEPLAVPGSKSLEKDIQFAREKSVLPALYFDKRRIPDSAEEPIPENHQMSDPVIIPLEDPESQEIDLRSTPWPEPKGPAPQIEQQTMPPMFPNMPFNPNFNNMGNMPPVAQFMGIPPRFPGPPVPHATMAPVPGNFVPPNMMHNNMMGPPMVQPDMMNSGPMNPNIYGPGPDGFIGPGNDPNYPMQQFNGPQAPNMNMYGPNNFNHRGGGGGRGGFRRGGANNGGWVQVNGPRSWKRGGGGGPRGGRLCKNIQNHGYCRNGDNCPFVH